MKDIEPVGFARRHADFVEVHKRVMAGELPSIAAPASPVAATEGDWVIFDARHGIKRA